MERVKVAISILVLFVVATGPAFAGIGVTPTRQEIRLEPGEESQGSYVVYNGADKPVLVKVSCEDWFKLAKNRQINVTSWLEVEPKEFTLAGHERKEVTYRVKLPEEAVGELVAMIYFGAESTESSMIHTKFGVSLYVRAKGTDFVEGKITDLSIRQVLPDEPSGPYVQTIVTVTNDGNVHLRPRIRTVVNDKKGSTIADISFPYGWPVYPGHSYPYCGYAMKKELEPGKYIVTATVDYGDSKNILTKAIGFTVDRDGKVTKIKKRGGEKR